MGQFDQSGRRGKRRWAVGMQDASCARVLITDDFVIFFTLSSPKATSMPVAATSASTEAEKKGCAACPRTESRDRSRPRRPQSHCGPDYAAASTSDSTDAAEGVVTKVAGLR